MLPIRTNIEDVTAVCGFLATRPTGATVKEARAVIDSKHLDGRKLSGLETWGLIEQQDDKLKITHTGRELIRDGGKNRAAVLGGILRGIPPYYAIVERVGHQSMSSITSTEVAAIWHDHFKEEVSTSDDTLNNQAVCFFHVAAGANLGSLTIGRKGAETRFDFDAQSVQRFINGLDTGVSTESTASEKLDERNTPASEEPQTPKSDLGQAIFVAHGKKKEPLEQLKSILTEFKIPHTVAVDEPHLGRPISAKVREIMQNCNCAIFIFTADEEFRTPQGETIWRPSENVVYELGAASYLYGTRIVILKQEEVSFPSDFKDLGYISFREGDLKGQSMEILKELIGLQILKVTPN